MWRILHLYRSKWYHSFRLFCSYKSQRMTYERQSLFLRTLWFLFSWTSSKLVFFVILLVTGSSVERSENKKSRFLCPSVLILKTNWNFAMENFFQLGHKRCASVCICNCRIQGVKLLQKLKGDFLIFHSGSWAEQKLSTERKLIIKANMGKSVLEGL